MDRLTPAPSFRPTRSITRARPRPRTRHISPSPRPGSRRPFAEPAPSFITTDYDRESDHVPSSSPDSDLIFSMSPVHSHLHASSQSGSGTVDVMTLHNRTRSATLTPPLSPTLYSFPRPSHAHAYVKQHPECNHGQASSQFQNLGASTFRRREGTPLSSCHVEARSAEIRPLTASLRESPSTRGNDPKTAASRRAPHSPRLSSYSSSPIPIPPGKSHRSDPGPFMPRPPPSLILSAYSSHDMHDPALASSGIIDIIGPQDSAFPSPRRGGCTLPSRQASFEGSTGSLTPLRRIEGFDDFEDDAQEQEQEQDQAFDSVADSRSPATPGTSTAYSYSGSGPFRFSRFLDFESGSPEVLSKRLAGGMRGDLLLGDWSKEHGGA